MFDPYCISGVSTTSHRWQPFHLASPNSTMRSDQGILEWSYRNFHRDLTIHNRYLWTPKPWKKIKVLSPKTMDDPSKNAGFKWILPRQKKPTPGTFFFCCNTTDFLQLLDAGLHQVEGTTRAVSKNPTKIMFSLWHLHFGDHIGSCLALIFWENC